VKIFLAACLFLLSVFPASLAWAGPHGHPAQPSDLSDPGYVFALAAANPLSLRLANADLEAGMVLLSDGIRHSQNPDKIERFFLGPPTPVLTPIPVPKTEPSRSRAAMDIRAVTVSP